RSVPQFLRYSLLLDAAGCSDHVLDALGSYALVPAQHSFREQERRACVKNTSFEVFHHWEKPCIVVARSGRASDAEHIPFSLLAHHGESLHTTTPSKQ
ncbi:MAG TPA: hypothetical protein VKQ36_05240, partial [Ktedonobacterales bacterium]|nr:hypothetical protein [Ktedonobacterales bacterium]